VRAGSREADSVRALAGLPAGIHVSDNAFFALCGDGRAIAIHELRHAPNLQHGGQETVITPAAFSDLISSVPRP
jgi:methionyl-tRNA formyltransferase